MPTHVVPGESRTLEVSVSARTFQKSADSKLDFTMDWSRWLPSGDTIASSEWALEGPDASLAIAGSPAPSHTDSSTTAWLEGGTLDGSYRVSNTIVTAEGREEKVHFWVNIVER